MGRPRATAVAAAAAAASRPRRTPKPKPGSSFLSPLASPSTTPRTRTRTRTRKGAIRRGGASPSPVSSSPGSSPADLNTSFLSSPGSPASPPKPKPKPRSRAKPNPNPDPSFLSPLASPSPSPSPAPRPRKRAVRRGGSSPASSSQGSDLSVSFLSSPSGSPASPPKPKPSTRAKRAARAPLVASPRAAATPSPAAAAVSPQPAPVSATGVASVGDLRTAVASQMENLKRRFDALHSRAHADLDASFSRVSKRIKTQNQACQQLADEVDKEYKKISDDIKESSEIARAKYKQIIAEAQASTARVCKVTIPEMTKSVEKAIDGLCTRYNISMPV